MCFLVAAWAFWNTISLLDQTAAGSLKYLRLADAFALFIPVTFLHFAMRFANRFKAGLLKISYLITGALALTVGTPLFVAEGQKKFGIWFEVGGPTFLAFAILFVLLPAYGIYLIYQTARAASDKTKQAQFFSLFFACALGFGGGFMWFLPAFNINIPPIGGHLIALYCVIVLYAIVRYRFLDIQLVIRRSLVYSILITLLTTSYFGLVYLIERIFQNSIGYKSAWISILSFGLMALVFQPLKSAIQKLVDWLVFRSTQEELGKRMELLEQQALLNEKLKAVSTLAAGMAHEIKNPLTILQTYAQFIPEKRHDDAFITTLQETLSSETRRIQQIVQDLLDFAKPKPPRMQPVDLAGLIQSTTNLFSGEFIKRKVNCEVHCDLNGALLQADRDQLRQVLINLVQNALDAMPAGGKLSIQGTVIPDEAVVLKISDTGEGIPKHLLPKIFDPFVTGKETGNGLGLTMVYSIVQAHRGTIQVDSTPEQGTTFTLRFPL